MPAAGHTSTNPYDSLRGPKTDRVKANQQERHAKGQQVTQALGHTFDNLTRMARRPGEPHDPQTLQPLRSPTPEQIIQQLQAELSRVNAKNAEYKDALADLNKSLLQANVDLRMRSNDFSNLAEGALRQGRLNNLLKQKIKDMQAEQ